MARSYANDRCPIGNTAEDFVAVRVNKGGVPVQRASSRLRPWQVPGGGWVAGCRLGKATFAAALFVGCSVTGVGTEVGSTSAPVIASNPPVVIRQLYGG